MADRRQIVKLLLEGKTAPQIMEELHIPPSKLRRALTGRRLAEVLELARLTAATGLAFSSGALARAAVGHLAAVATGGGNAEAARRACMTIIGAATGGGPGPGAPAVSGGRARDRDGQKRVETGSIGQPRVAMGSYGQAV